MATKALNRVIQYLRRAAVRQDGGGMADSDLLECYVTRGDEVAFEALVRRHGPMVLGVCRRILRNEADAEDAFQATFLVLVRKAGNIRPRGMVSNWLFGVAQNTALKAKAMIHKRRAKEKEAGTMPKPEVAEEVWRQLQTLLDEELSRLPDKYRVPIVLCELEGQTIKEAARHLGWPQGTVATRLAHGRRMLAKRLCKHGLTLPGGALAALLSQGAASASVPAPLVISTVKAASLFAAGQAAATSVISAKVAALTEGVLKTMLLTKLKITAAMLLVVATLAVGLRGLMYETQASPPANTRSGPEAKEEGAGSKGQVQAKESGELRRYLESLRWKLSEVDLKKNVISLRLMGPYSGQAIDGENRLVITDLWSRLVLDEIPVAKDAKVSIDGKEGKLQDLKEDMALSLEFTAQQLAGVNVDGTVKEGLAVSLEFTPAKLAIARIHATSPKHPDWAVLTKSDIKKNTISVALGGREVTLPLTADAKVYVYKKEAEFKDLKPGMWLELRLGVGERGMVVTGVHVIRTPAQRTGKTDASKPGVVGLVDKEAPAAIRLELSKEFQLDPKYKIRLDPKYMPKEIRLDPKYMPKEIKLREPLPKEFEFKLRDPLPEIRWPPNRAFNLSGAAFLFRAA